MAALSKSTAAAAAAERSKLVLDSLQRAIMITDLDGALVAWNKGAERLYDWRSDDVVGRSFLDLVVPPEDRTLAEELLHKVASGDTWSGDAMVLRRDGSMLRTSSFAGPVRDEDGTVIAMVAASHDVTELRALHQRTNELADRLLLALAAGDLGTWQWDKASGVTTWDETMERLFGLEPGTFDGTFDAWVALLHPDDVGLALATLERATADKSHYEIEHRVVWPDGSIHWIHGRGMVTLDAHGEVTGTIGSTGDITARKQLELDADRRAREAEHLIELERLERQRLEFLTTLNDAALSADDHIDLIRRVVNAAVPQLGDWCALTFIPEAGSPPQIEIGHSDPAKVAWAADLLRRFPYDPDAPTGAAAVVRTGRTEFVPDLGDEDLQRVLEMSAIDPAELREILDILTLTSVITVPLTTKHGVVGAIQFVSAESRRRYDERDVALAEAAAGRIAAALDSAWIADQQRVIAAALQSALLPPRLPIIDGVTIAVRYWAAGTASEVGGDFYDVFAAAERRWALVIGDVCGTGPQAAAVTAIARHTIRAAATHGADHHQVLDWLNDAIHAGNRGLFCTALFATLEPLDNGRWRFTSIAGGHPLPVLATSTGTVRTIGAPGTLLGVLTEVAGTPEAVELGPGDTVVLYTDGVTDVHPPYGIDTDALLQLVADAAAVDGPAEVVVQRIGAAVQSVLPIPERNDDVAVVVVRIDEWRV